MDLVIFLPVLIDIDLFQDCRRKLVVIANTFNVLDFVKSGLLLLESLDISFEDQIFFDIGVQSKY